MNKARAWLYFSHDHSCLYLKALVIRMSGQSGFLMLGISLASFAFGGLVSVVVLLKFASHIILRVWFFSLLN